MNKIRERTPAICFNCKFCKQTFSTFKELVEHYGAEHESECLKRYEISHIPSGDRAINKAATPEEACWSFGWKVSDCKVKEVPDEDRPKEIA